MNGSAREGVGTPRLDLPLNTMPIQMQQYTQEQLDNATQLKVDMDDDFQLVMLNWSLFHLVQCSDTLEGWTGSFGSVAHVLAYAEEHGLQCLHDGQPYTIAMFLGDEQQAEDASPVNSDAEAAEPEAEDPCC